MALPLEIAAAQPLTLSGEIGLNGLAHASAIRLARARVVVFPEMSLTGYELDARPIAVDDPRLTPIVETCAETSSLAFVGAPVDDGHGGMAIGMLAIDGGGARVAYRKMWLGGDEESHFHAGREPAVIDVDGWRLGLAICRDTGVSRHATDTAALGMDVYLAGVLEFVEDASVPEERARRVALEHHVWVAIASFAGPTGGGYNRTAGCSGIWSPAGNAVARAGTEPGAVARATLA